MDLTTQHPTKRVNEWCSEGVVSKAQNVYDILDYSSYFAKHEIITKRPSLEKVCPNIDAFHYYSHLPQTKKQNNIY